MEWPEIDEVIRRAGATRMMQAPGLVTALRTVDGRVIADIEGKPSIDITDWFSDEPPATGAN